MVAYVYNTYAYTQFDSAVKENKVINFYEIVLLVKISYVMNFKRKYSHIESFKVTVNGEYSPKVYVPRQIPYQFNSQG
jgi:hypothetical protein